MKYSLIRLLLLSLLIVLHPYSSFASEKIELKLSHFMPTRHAQHKIMEEWAQNVANLSEDKLVITIFPGGVLGKPPRQYDSVLNGVTDIAFGLPSYTPGRFPLTSSMELPFLASNAVQGSKVFWNLYEQYLSEEFQDTKILWMLTSGPSQLHTTKKAVKNLADLKGLKIRTPGAMVSNILKELGAVPISMPITEVYMALERGTIDGICAPWAVMKPFRLDEQLKFTTEINLYTQTFFVAMNMKKYESLPPEMRKILNDTTGLKMALAAGAAYDNSDLPDKKMSMKNGVEVFQLSEEERLQWREKVQPIYKRWLEDINKKGLPGNQVITFLLKELKATPP